MGQRFSRTDENILLATGTFRDRTAVWQAVLGQLLLILGLLTISFWVHWMLWSAYIILSCLVFFDSYQCLKAMREDRR